MLGVIPLGAIALQEMGVISKAFDEKRKMHRHILLLVTFLIVSHVAMVFGMVSPSLGGWQPAPQYDMMDSNMSGMHHTNGASHGMNH